MMRFAPREVDWTPIAVSLRHLLNGTNLFAYPLVKELLVETNLSPALARRLLDEGAVVLLLAHLRADHALTRARALRFLTHVRGESLSTPAEWEAWLTNLR
jgi:hypothetical protein